jgi:hypothetical protein
MSDELRSLDISDLTMDDLRHMKNKAINRLKAAGQFALDNAAHQNGVDHRNHTTTIIDFDCAPDLADIAIEAQSVPLDTPPLMPEVTA